MWTFQCRRSAALNTVDLQRETPARTVLKVLGKHDIAEVEEAGELGDGEVPHTPGVLELVGDAGVEDEAPPRGGRFVNGAPKDSMKRGRGQPQGTISTMPCQVQVANLGQSAIFAASLRSQASPSWSGLGVWSAAGATLVWA